VSSLACSDDLSVLTSTVFSGDSLPLSTSTLQLQVLAIGGNGDLAGSSQADLDLGSELEEGAASMAKSSCSTLHRGIEGTFDLTCNQEEQHYAQICIQVLKA
jgi:hypothetical protein